MTMSKGAGGPEVVELHLDVAAACDPGDGAVPERVAALGVTITTLAEEHRRDPEALAKLYSLALVVHDRPRWSLEEYLERFDRWEAVFIATTGPVYVGYTYLTEPQDSPGLLKQCMTGVRPEYRRYGIATALKTRGIEYARAHGFGAIATRVRPDNEASLALNRKLGFREAKTPTAG